MKRMLLLLTLILGLVISACTPSAATAKTQFCTSLAGLVQAANNVKSITKETTVDQAKQYVNTYQAAWQNVVNANRTLKAAQFDELQNAYNTMNKSIASISGQTSIEAAVPQIQAAWTEFTVAANNVSGANCKP